MDCPKGGATGGAVGRAAMPLRYQLLIIALGARPCLCPIGAVGLSLCICVCVCVFVCACVSVCLCVSLGILWGWDGWYILSLLFSASVRYFVLLLKYERCHTNKV